MKKIFILPITALIVGTGILFAVNHNNSGNPDPLPQTGTGSITATLLNMDFGTPIVKASVILHAEGAETAQVSDEKGNVSFLQLESGTYILTLRAIGYQTIQDTIALAAGENKNLEYAMITAVELTEKEELDKVEIISADEYMYDAAAPVGNVSMSMKSKSADAAYASGTTTFGMQEAYDGEEGNFNTESYDVINENIFKKTVGNPLSTFSIDVDNASYSNIRRYVSYGQLPPQDAVRIEEMVNYFDFAYAQPKGDAPFSINYEMSECPWNPETRLVMVGLQGKDIDFAEADPSNLVFLIDVSGSMGDANKLPLVRRSLSMLVDNLNEKDRVAIVVYAGAAGEVLPSTACNNKQAIKDALNRLEAGGSTAGGAGIKLAYDIAMKNLIPGGNNRVILCTDGDFNVGASSDGEMTRLIEEKRKSGVFITLCGFGMGNYKDSKMEKIADNGNGAYFYIDSEKEAKKVFTTDMRGTLFTIAKDVKIQVEFNPAMVEEYRLIGYENRVMNNEDFDNDQKDAGELGAGHRVTALYEVKLASAGYQPKGLKETTDGQELKYQTTTINKQAYNTDEIMTLRLRYKDPNAETSKLIEKSLSKNMVPFNATSDNYRFACAVVEFGMLLRKSEFAGDASYDEILKLANSARGNDANGYRDEFIEMVRSCMGYAQNQTIQQTGQK
ncbi:MAG: von Willebrand factor type A domain-containing protein [Chitinophagales bacterium]